MKNSIENNKKTFKKFEKGTNRVSYGNGFQNIPNFTYYDEFNEEYAREFANNSDFYQKKENQQCCHESYKQSECCDKSEFKEYNDKYNQDKYTEDKYKQDEYKYDKYFDKSKKEESANESNEYNKLKKQKK